MGWVHSECHCDLLYDAIPAFTWNSRGEIHDIRVCVCTRSSMLSEDSELEGKTDEWQHC
jgi:hypothetical protein